MTLRLPTLIASLLMLASCTTMPPVTADERMCRFETMAVPVDEPPQQLRARFGDTDPDGAKSMLILSGGSQHGAFGAGFLQQWAIREGGLPKVDIVNGISTGAIMSTSAFLGDADVPANAYSIDAESDVLHAYARKKNGKLTLDSYPAILRHNAVGHLGPLRELLARHISFETLRRVAEQPKERELWIGAVDVDSGDSVLFDMDEMARRAVSHGNNQKYLDCYLDAILASASVPLAAPPTFIDNRMYIDGGARFGVFAQSFGSRLGLPLRASEAMPGSGPGPAVYILINGDQEVGPHCGKLPEGGGVCPGGYDPHDNRPGAHKGWNLIGLAQRSSDILVNQVYRFSVADIMQRYKAAYPQPDQQHLHYARIRRAEMLAHRFPRTGYKTCADWRAQDEKELNPLEFYPRYMACLIDYGRFRAETVQWEKGGGLSDSF